MPPSPFRHRNLPLLLLRSREALMAQFRPALREHGLTDQQWRIARALAEHDALEPRQLCELCMISSPSLTGVLARMEEMGLVVREPVPGDQRRLKVRLTREAGRLVKRIGAQSEARYQALEAAIGVERLHAVYDHLDALLQHLGQAEPADGAQAPAKARFTRGA
jgi:homoprotocatechuate degradation regulator HpaR